MEWSETHDAFSLEYLEVYTKRNGKEIIYNFTIMYAFGYGLFY